MCTVPLIMPTLHSKRNYAALGGLCCVIALFFALKDPVAVRKSEEDAAAARRRELVTSAGATCTLGYAGGDLSTVQPFPEPAPVSLRFTRTPSSIPRITTNKDLSILICLVGSFPKLCPLILRHPSPPLPHTHTHADPPHTRRLLSRCLSIYYLLLLTHSFNVQTCNFLTKP